MGNDKRDRLREAFRERSTQETARTHAALTGMRQGQRQGQRQLDRINRIGPVLVAAMDRYAGPYSREYRESKADRMLKSLAQPKVSGGLYYRQTGSDDARGTNRVIAAIRGAELNRENFARILREQKQCAFYALHAKSAESLADYLARVLDCGRKTGQVPFLLSEPNSLNHARALVRALWKLGCKNLSHTGKQWRSARMLEVCEQWGILPPWHKPSAATFDQVYASVGQYDAPTPTPIHVPSAPTVKPSSVLGFWIRSFPATRAVLRTAKPIDTVYHAVAVRDPNAPTACELDVALMRAMRSRPIMDVAHLPED